jgi:uncharacterized protein DUF6893
VGSERFIRTSHCLLLIERLVIMRFNINLGPFGFGRRKRSNHLLLKVIGGAALAVVGAGVIRMLPDIRRYIHISTM